MASYPVAKFKPFNQRLAVIQRPVDDETLNHPKNPDRTPKPKPLTEPFTELQGALILGSLCLRATLRKALPECLEVLFSNVFVEDLGGLSKLWSLFGSLL